MTTKSVKNLQVTSVVVKTNDEHTIGLVSKEHPLSLIRKGVMGTVYLGKEGEVSQVFLKTIAEQEKEKRITRAEYSTRQQAHERLVEQTRSMIDQSRQTLNRLRPNQPFQLMLL